MGLLCTRTHMNRALSRRVLHGIVHQVHQDLGEALLIGLQQETIRRKLQFDRTTRKSLLILDDLAAEAPDITWGQPEWDLPRTDATQIKQIIDQCSQALRVNDNRF